MIVLGIERQQVAGAQLKFIKKDIVIVGMVAGDIDLLDRGDLAFGDLDGHLDPITGLLGDDRVDLDAVLAAAIVLTTQFLLDLVEQRPVKDLAFGQSDPLQRLLEIIRGNVLVAIEGHARNRGPLLDHHHQGVAILLQPDILEEAGFKKGLDAFSGQALIELIPDLDRQVVKDGARRDPLQAFDADILDGEVLRRPEGERQPQQRRQQKTDQGPRHGHV